MPPTTAILKSAQVNMGAAATGKQSTPQIIGLSNGNIFVAWTDHDSTVGGRIGADIIGKIYDPLGNVLRDSFQINTTYTYRDETQFDIAPTNDGGFAAVYGHSIPDHGIPTSFTNLVEAEIKSETGNTVRTEQIYLVDDAANSFSRSQIAVNQLSNAYAVTYADPGPFADDIFGHTQFSQGFDAATNSFQREVSSRLAVLSNSFYVSVYSSGFFPGLDTEGFIFNAAGHEVATVLLGSGPTFAPSVASLADGGFVAVWSRSDGGDGDIRGRIVDNFGSYVTSNEFLIAGGPAAQGTPDVAGLPDGRFVVFWDEEGFGHRARIMRSDLTFDGGVIDVAKGDTHNGSVSVTADGRILFAWEQADDIRFSVWDPRGGVIDARDFRTSQANLLDNGGPVIGNPVLGDLIEGTRQSDTIFGVGGEDTIRAGAGDDAVFGGAERDHLHGQFGDDLMNGGGGSDWMAGGSGGDRMAGGGGSDTLLGGAGRDTLLGGNGKDRMFGNGGDDRLLGGKQNDVVRGGNGDDLMKGGAGNDRIFGGKGGDTIIAGNGRDFINGNGGPDDFVFDKKDGNNKIRGFDLSEDDIVIKNGASGFRDLGISQAGNKAIVEFGSTKIELLGVDADELDPGHFIF